MNWVFTHHKQIKCLWYMLHNICYVIFSWTTSLVGQFLLWPFVIAPTLTRHETNGKILPSEQRPCCCSFLCSDTTDPACSPVHSPCSSRCGLSFPASQDLRISEASDMQGSQPTQSPNLRDHQSWCSSGNADARDEWPKLKPAPPLHAQWRLKLTHPPRVGSSQPARGK